ncbi:MAG: lytic transglycosylase domain-containing protein [Acidiphilium sp.]|nr:lytic transglycosylase domain-containing protein [Acidiphilium sp.]MDD4937188.1 lytic transglycosylase domain-containing protein [Acidiphilium sp.]
MMPEARRWAFKLAGVAGLALLSACASHQSSLPPTQQAADYAAHSPGNYSAPGPASDPWGPYIEQASARFDVPTKWIRQVMRVESGGHEYMNGHLTVSYAGAMGLMQLEPETYREMAARYGLGPDPYNPYNNIMAGTAYIHEMYQIYGSPGFLAAYNAGPGRLDDYLDYKQSLPNQTRQYVAMIAPNIAGVYPASQSAAVDVAMNTLPAQIRPGMRPGAENASTESLNATQLASNGPLPTFPTAMATPQDAAARVMPAPQPQPQPRPMPPQAPVQMAALTPPPVIERPRYTPPVARVMPPVHPDTGFSLIPTAEAAAPPPPPPSSQIENASLGTGTRWGIQVGAYDTPAHAKAALGIAELTAVSSLIKGQAVVQSISTAHGQFFRARFVDLPHEQAVAACQRLNGGPTGCEVLSPAAQ